MLSITPDQLCAAGGYSPVERKGHSPAYETCKWEQLSRRQQDECRRWSRSVDHPAASVSQCAKHYDAVSDYVAGIITLDALIAAAGWSAR